jgi:HlyD family secretion protein
LAAVSADQPVPSRPDRRVDPIDLSNQRIDERNGGPPAYRHGGPTRWEETVTVSRTSLSWIFIAAVLAGALLVGWQRWRETPAALPEGIVSGNGRIEARQIDVAALYAGRVLEVPVTEGELVREGATLAEMDTADLEAQFDRAEAEAALAREALSEAEAIIVQRESELRLAGHELERVESLAAQGHVPQATLEARQTARDVAMAALAAAKANAATGERRIAATEAEVRRIRRQIADATLTAPAPARVLYRLAAPGEVVAGGQPILTLLDLRDVYMEIFLPAREAGRLAIGAEGRIVLDVIPEYAIPAAVSFVSPEAQFTPRQVETLEERENLVFRVRVRISPDLVQTRIDHVKTGLRGVAYVRLSPSIPWPEHLERRIPPELFE